MCGVLQCGMIFSSVVRETMEIQELSEYGIGQRRRNALQFSKDTQLQCTVWECGRTLSTLLLMTIQSEYGIPIHSWNLQCGVLKLISSLQRKKEEESSQCWCFLSTARDILNLPFAVYPKKSSSSFSPLPSPSLGNHHLFNFDHYANVWLCRRRTFIFIPHFSTEPFFWKWSEIVNGMSRNNVAEKQ